MLYTYIAYILIGMGNPFRAHYPPDQIALAHSTDLKLFED